MSSFGGVEMILITAILPTLDVLMEETGVADLFELCDDTLISEPLIEHGIDEETNEAGKPGYLAGATSSNGLCVRVHNLVF
jgi:hypothetical protein